MAQVTESEMTKSKQLERAKELYANATEANLHDLILMADAANTAYILYGVKNDIN